MTGTSHTGASGAGQSGAGQSDAGQSGAGQSGVVVRGLGALAKSLVLVAGVPLAVGRLWMLLPGPRTPLASAAWHGSRAGGHGVLLVVAATWLLASGRLARDLARALTGRLGPVTGSWSTRWASRVAGLLLLVSAGSAVSAGLAAASATTTVTAAPRGTTSLTASPLTASPLTAHSLPAHSLTAPSLAPPSRTGGTAAARVPTGETSTAAHLDLYRVEPGDCLASIAARELGDAGDWPALARLNIGRPQPDGRRMTDPSLIYPGWLLVLPPRQAQAVLPGVLPVAQPVRPPSGRAGGPAQDRPDSARVVAAPRARTRPGGTGEPGPKAASARGDSEQPHVSLDHPDDELAAGAARTRHVAVPGPAVPRRHLDELAILGVGVLGAVGLARRLRSQRRARSCLRRPGERVATPATEAGHAASLLEPLADAELLDWVDVANRLLWRGCRRRAHEAPSAPLPEVRRVRVGPDGVELELWEPIPDAVEGFTAREHGWTWSLDTDGGLAVLSSLATGCGRYAPLLVPVGDAADASYLVALGPGRRLSVDGVVAPGQAYLPVGDAAPAEGCPPAETSAKRALAGILVALAATPWSDELEVELVGTPLAPGTARLLGLNTSSAAELAELARDEATSPLDRLGSAWSAELLVVVGPSPSSGCGAAVDDTLLDAVGGRAGIVSLGGAAPDRVVVEADRLVLEPGGIELQRACPTPAQLALLTELLEESAADPLPVVPAPGGAGPVASPPGPIEIRLLRRTPDVVGWVAEPPSKDRARVVELLAFLALHGYAASGDRIRSAVFSRGGRSATLGRVHNVCSTARRALGAAPDGSSYLPAATRGRYRLDPSVTTDWARFEARRLRALEAEPDEAVTLLGDALEMLESPPLADTACGWDWMLAEGLLATIAASIVDAAHHLATLGLAAGDTARARWAIAKGRSVEPWSETLARDTMVLADAEGDRDAVRRTWQDLEGALDRLDGNEPSPETRALFESLVGQRR